MNQLERVHPGVLFLYYVTIIGITMFLMNPYILVLSLLGALTYYRCLCNRKRWYSDLVYYCFLFILFTITNPLFVHNGVTILFFLNDNPITLEAIQYGATISCMIVAVMYWGKCYQFVMTTDKFLYLFSKGIPQLAIVLSMAIRFIPLIKRQRVEVNKVQKTMGLYTSDSIFDRVKNGLRLFDSILMWGLENSIDTADSMQARGYGSGKRTNYTIFRIRKSDIIGSILLITVVVITCIGYQRGDFMCEYYPKMQMKDLEAGMLWEYGFIAIPMFLPTIITIKEKVKWKYLKSKI
jgi:energy-coupling factor transport system permease protein